MKTLRGEPALVIFVFLHAATFKSFNETNSENLLVLCKTLADEGRATAELLTMRVWLFISFQIQSALCNCKRSDNTSNGCLFAFVVYLTNKRLSNSNMERILIDKSFPNSLYFCFIFLVWVYYLSYFFVLHFFNVFPTSSFFLRL